MIIWTVDLLARPGQAERFVDVATWLSTSSRELDAGCDVYVCLQSPADSHRLLWYEQWADDEALRAHIDRVVPELGGRPRDGEALPPVLSDTLAERVVTAWQAVGDPALLQVPWAVGSQVEVVRGPVTPAESGPGRLWHRAEQGSDALLVDLSGRAGQRWLVVA